MPVPPTKVLLPPDVVAAMPPEPPVTDVPAPLPLKNVVPEPPPKTVEAAPDETVSFGAANTVAGVVRVMLFPPAVVSTTALAPLTVTAEFVDATTTGPVTVETPLPEKTVNVVPELK
jgi:hypothetical protein